MRFGGRGVSRADWPVRTAVRVSHRRLDWLLDWPARASYEVRKKKKSCADEVGALVVREFVSRVHPNNKRTWTVQVSCLCQAHDQLHGSQVCFGPCHLASFLTGGSVASCTVCHVPSANAWQTRLTVSWERHCSAWMAAVAASSESLLAKHVRQAAPVQQTDRPPGQRGCSRFAYLRLQALPRQPVS